MTAEISVMNKKAIALAADSAVTFKSRNGQKIYNTANKLFALSKYHPIGIMIFGNAEIMDVPWETIVKLFKKHLKDKSYNYVKEYADSFLTFIENSTELFPNNVQDAYVITSINDILHYNVELINNEVKNIIIKNGKIEQTELIDVINKVINRVFDGFKNADDLKICTTNFEKEFNKKYSKRIGDAIKTYFQKLPLNRTLKLRLRKLSYYIFCKKKFPSGISGVVFAGFGEKEHFPSLHAYTVEALVMGKLKYALLTENSVTHDNSSAIIPFAQREMVDTFMEGINPNLEKSLYGFFHKTINGYVDTVVSSFTKLMPDDIVKLKKDLLNSNEQLTTEFMKFINESKAHNFINPILANLDALPIPELASMAEALVNLTSFKRKVSLDEETVGGPIDVAVISKGDGLIWIQRKHYFQPELNQHFFSNYFRCNELEE